MPLPRRSLLAGLGLTLAAPAIMQTPVRRVKAQLGIIATMDIPAGALITITQNGQFKYAKVADVMRYIQG